MPRLLAGSISIIPLGTSEYADTGSTVPIGPVSSNFTQGIYFSADLLCFMLTVAVGSTIAGFRAVVTALLAYAAANAAFALIDVATYATGTQWALEFLRNAKYTLHIEEEVGGLKRIAGSFPEASAFAGSTLGALGFTATLWIRGYRPRMSGPLAAASLALVILSTSSAGLAATPPLLAILYVTAMTRNGFTMDRPLRSALLDFAPLLAIGLILAVALNDAASDYVSDFLGTLIFNKSASSSGIERSSWNHFALQNFFDSGRDWGWFGDGSNVELSRCVAGLRRGARHAPLPAILRQSVLRLQTRIRSGRERCSPCLPQHLSGTCDLGLPRFTDDRAGPVVLCVRRASLRSA